MTCQHCNKHKGTQNWVGEGGFLEFSHGMYQVWCQCCILKAQLKYAKKRADQVQILEQKLKKLKCL